MSDPLEQKARDTTCVKTDWVKCPICGSPDTKLETRRDSGGEYLPLIFCTNHVCRSNDPTGEGYDERLSSAIKSRDEALARVAQLEEDVKYHRKIATPKTMDELEAVNLRSLVADQELEITQLRAALSSAQKRLRDLGQLHHG